ncbi:hypothetical protein HanLR1_Chr06g0223421 [Helianthus annuus]|nr:hypothetical protein HanHA89_Chr06g0239511 [Helianthus annuus]KAJ0738889.1 hypothetical protein HanLR1_Chr06g0223421 [Helianthus annuus]
MGHSLYYTIINEDKYALLIYLYILSYIVIQFIGSNQDFVIHSRVFFLSFGEFYQTSVHQINRIHRHKII